MPAPEPAARFEDEPFWTGGEHGELRVMRCHACSSWIHPPSPTCRSCGSQDLGHQAVAGRATVFSFTVNHQAWTAELEVPYVIAIVALDDAPVHLTTRLVDVDPDEVAIDMPVTVRFERVASTWLPLFTPVLGVDR